MRKFSTFLLLALTLNFSAFCQRTILLDKKDTLKCFTLWEARAILDTIYKEKITGAMKDSAISISAKKERNLRQEVKVADSVAKESEKAMSLEKGLIEIKDKETVALKGRIEVLDKKISFLKKVSGGIGAVAIVEGIVLYFKK